MSSVPFVNPESGTPACFSKPSKEEREHYVEAIKLEFDKLDERLGL